MFRPISLIVAGYRALLLPLLFLLFSVITQANQTQFSCGDLRNISFPFALQGQLPPRCSDQTSYTLACENNHTVLNLYAGKYYVREIDYYHHTIRLVDVGIHSNACSSFPLRSLSPNNFSYSDPYGISSWSLVVYLHCDIPVRSGGYINRTGGYCGREGNYYALIGEVRVWDLADSCTLDAIAISSSTLLNEGGAAADLSFSDVNKELEYGFEASWQLSSCRECKRRASCFAVDATGVCSTVCSFQPPFLEKLWDFIQSQALLGLVTLGAIFAARFLLAPCAFGFIIYKFMTRHLSMFDNIEDFLQYQNNLMPIRYSYSDIKKMTKGFRDKLGEGGYGSVYGGKLRSGSLVAIKMLSKPKADGQEFINEVGTIGRIHHVNVVRLIGYCAERSKRALVYEFMPYGSLEKYISAQEGSISLSCEQMFEIALGVAHGIDYLHRGCEMQILHFDIKPHNILLDRNFVPKVSDFGLAKLYPTDNSIVALTAARGTMGYMAPELFYKNIGGVSYKADVYSYGMLLMELASRRRNWNASAASTSSQVFFPSWVYDQLAAGRHVDIGEGTEEERAVVKKMMVVALWCIQMKPSDRPSMSKAVEMLEGNTELLHMPPKPFLYPEEIPTENGGVNPNLPNLSGACLESITIDVSPR